MLTIKNIESIKGKHFGDKEMRIWNVYEIMIGTEYYHFFVQTNPASIKAWFRLHRKPDRAGSYLLVRGTDGQGQSMQWISIHDINNVWHLCSKFTSLI